MLEDMIDDEYKQLLPNEISSLMTSLEELNILPILNRNCTGEEIKPVFFRVIKYLNTPSSSNEEEDERQLSLFVAYWEYITQILSYNERLNLIKSTLDMLDSDTILYTGLKYLYSTSIIAHEMVEALDESRKMNQCKKYLYGPQIPAAFYSLYVKIKALESLELLYIEPGISTCLSFLYEMQDLTASPERREESLRRLKNILNRFVLSFLREFHASGYIISLLIKQVNYTSLSKF